MGWLLFPNEVIRCLVTYTDWWQPATSSLIQVGAAARRGNGHTDGLQSGLLENLDKRTELCLRMQQISDRDRQILFLWYVEQLPVWDIARAVGISRRQCFRRRAQALRKIAELGEDQVTSGE